MRILRNGIIWVVLVAALGFGAKLLWHKLHPASSNANTIAVEKPLPTSQPHTVQSLQEVTVGFKSSITITPVATPAAAVTTPLTPAQLFQRVSPSVVQVVIYDNRGEASKYG
ncbi:MAG TPA: hypothetical protein VGP94_14250, partial [Tepidisphaeraceae bacterium]|nr:hypothetical protein [Tepidisphaeraceae bacterium]